MVPSFETIPEHWKAPVGPYVQAPAEYGGKWYLSNPFTGVNPWETQGKVEAPAYPDRFVEVFGPRPQVRQPEDRHRLARWEQDLKHFKQAADSGPEGELLDDRTFESWGLGKGVFVEGRYGWSVHFPKSSVDGFKAAVFTAVESPHLVIARYQIRLYQDGVTPPVRHPFVPPQVVGDVEP